MNTQVLIDHEAVADGGHYARAVLLIEGALPDDGYVSAEPGRVPRSIEAVNRVAATNVRVVVTPGVDAEFIQMRHTFESACDGKVLTIQVGDVYCLDRIRIRMEALVGIPEPHVELGAILETGTAEVASVLVVSELRTREGPTVETVELPIVLSGRAGGSVRPAVSRRLLSVEPLMGSLGGE